MPAEVVNNDQEGLDFDDKQNQLNQEVDVKKPSALMSEDGLGLDSLKSPKVEVAQPANLGSDFNLDEL